MREKFQNKKIITIMLTLVALLVLTGCQGETVVIQDGKAEQYNTLSVSGKNQQDFAPDQAEILLTIESKGETAEATQDQNNVASKRVIDSLNAAGVAKGDLETVTYTVNPIYEWEDRKRVFKGYKVIHTLKLTTNNVDNVGKYLDIAVSNGVNQVQNIQFTLSKKALSKAKEAVLKAAAKNAKEKADALASSLSVSIVTVRSISESSFDYMPYRPVYARSLEAEFAESPPIEPEKVGITASVQVIFEISTFH